MAYELSEKELAMTPSQLYDLAIFEYARDKENEREERFVALLRAAIKKSGGRHVRALWALAEHLSIDDATKLEAAKLYERIAKRHGDARAAYYAGYLLYYRADKSETTRKRALSLLTMAAEENIAEAIEMVATHYRIFGYSDAEGERLAARLLKKVEDTRLFAFHTSTMGNVYDLLGHYLSEGCGCEADPKGAFEAFEMAVNYGNRVCLCDLGECYLNGFGVECDPARAFECFMETKYLAASKYRIGYAYIYGIGAEKNEAVGIKWLKEADESGDADATFELALAAIEGRGVEKDEEKGIEIMRRAFDEGASMRAYEYLAKLFPDEFPME